MSRVILQTNQVVRFILNSVNYYGGPERFPVRAHPPSFGLTIKSKPKISEEFLEAARYRGDGTGPRYVSSRARSAIDERISMAGCHRIFTPLTCRTEQSTFSSFSNTPWQTRRRFFRSEQILILPVRGD
jgi:hypothetical protein